MISKPDKTKIKKASRADNDQGSVTQEHGTEVLGEKKTNKKNKRGLKEERCQMEMRKDKER